MIFDNVVIKFEGNPIKLPKMAKARQTFETTKLESVSETIEKGIAELNSPLKDKRIAITVGSRGIHGIAQIIKDLVNQLISVGAKPFIVPAMGSHGGATSAGQREVVEGYGLGSKETGVPLLDSMDVVDLGIAHMGLHVFCQKDAFEADGIIVINKIKPHADFKGDLESGLSKMMVVGLGKHVGATALHKYGFENMGVLLEPATRLFLEKAPVILGVGILENAHDEIMMLDFIQPESIIDREKELLKIAKKNVAKINLSQIDVLIIEKIGKDISGEGMDPNVTGRPGSYLFEGFDAPEIQRIVVLGVTEQSHGNAVGIGMADVTVRSLIEQVDLGQIYTNAVTSTLVGPAKIPIVMKTDQEAVDVALRLCNRLKEGQAKIVQIRSTLHLDEILVSEACAKEIHSRSDIELISDFEPIAFGQDGTLKKLGEYQ